MDDYSDAKVSAKLKQTKFPVARIKRIMQKDDEVGKVAQATPIVISKALELFLSKLVEDTAEVTTSRGAKRVEAYHLKHAIDTTESFDFLRELVASVPDPSAGGTVSMREPASGSGDAGALDSDEEVVAPKKRKARRKKAEPDAEETEGVEKKRRGRKPKEPAEGEQPKKRGRKKKDAVVQSVSAWTTGVAQAHEPKHEEPRLEEPMEEEEEEHGGYDDDVPIRDDEDDYDDQDGGYKGGYGRGGHDGGKGGWSRR